MKHQSLFLFLISLFSSYQIYAQSLSGAEITYQYLGNDSFLIDVNVYTGCFGGSSLTSIDSLVVVHSDCGYFLPSFNLTSSNLEISEVCDSSLNLTNCNNGNLEGNYRHIFQTIVELPPCANWEIFYSGGTRVANQNLTSGSLGVKATVNNITAPKNNSPKFRGSPIKYVCAGSTIPFSFQATDEDGDSLSYRFIEGYSGFNTPNIFNFPYSGIQPIIGITLDPKTGQGMFTPTAVGRYVVVVEISEYNSQKQLIGTIMKDAVINVLNCFNSVPNPTINTSNLNNVTAENQTINACSGLQSSFSVTVKDNNPNDSLSFNSNIADVISGATYQINYLGGMYDSALVTFNFLPNFNLKDEFQFYLSANDNACPYKNEYHWVFKVKNGKINAGPDVTICQGTQEAALKIANFNKVNWMAISGINNLVVGPQGVGNISCDTCLQATFYPNTSSCLQVTSNPAFQCSADTVCVNVVPDFSLIHSVDTLICSNDSVALSANHSPSNISVSYAWSGENIKSSNSPQIKAKPISNSNYFVKATSNAGCEKTANIMVNLGPKFPINNKIIASDSMICNQDTILLAAIIGDVSPISCGINTQTCQGYKSTVQVGTDTLKNRIDSSINLSFPTPFAGGSAAAKQQFLFRADQLLQSGLTAGTINSISFDVLSNSGPLIYNEFTIKIGCTSDTALTSVFLSNLNTVFLPKPMFPMPGLNNLPFDFEYNWDGQSNLVLEIFFLNGYFSNNAIVNHSSTNYISATYARASNAQTNWNPSVANDTIKKLPNFGFGLCSGVDTNSLTYQWLGGINPIPPTTINTKNVNVGVNLNSPPVFTVVVSDTFGLCTDTITTNISVYPAVNATINPPSTLCSIDSTIQLNAVTSGGKWSGLGITDSLLGLFDPAIAGVGTAQVSYSILNGACTDSSTVSFVVDTAPKISFLVNNQQINDYCENDSTIKVLQGTPLGSGGSWQHLNGWTSTETFVPFAVGVGAFYSVYSYVAPSGCSSSDTAEIIIKPILPQGNISFDTLQKSISINGFNNTDSILVNIYFNNSLKSQFWVTDTTIFADSTGNYRVEVFSLCGTWVSNTYNLVVLGESNHSITKTQLMVWPNPANETLYIHIAGHETSQVNKVEIYNLQGKRVAEQNITLQNNRAKLNLINLAPGMYVCKVVGKDVYTQKFTKL